MNDTDYVFSYEDLMEFGRHDVTFNEEIQEILHSMSPEQLQEVYARFGQIMGPFGMALAMIVKMKTGADEALDTVSGCLESALDQIALLSHR